jgi:DMSO/TMAO reductase YedYZ molybdopterin-dependent catalytic subunit
MDFGTSSDGEQADDRAVATRDTRQVRVGGITRAAIAGFAAAAAALAASELVAGLVPGVPSLIIAVGSRIIALQPPGAKDLMATLFGTADKEVLNVAVAGVALGIGALAGAVGVRRPLVTTLVFVAFGMVGFIAAAASPDGSPPLALVAGLVAIAVGLLALFTLRTLAGFDRVAGTTFDGAAMADVAGASTPSPAAANAAVPDWPRRRFLVASGGILAAAAFSGTIGRLLLERSHPTAAPIVATRLPAPVNPAGTPPLEASFAVPGISPVVTPTADFYRIDTALLVPQVDASTWRLRVLGMVDHPLTLTYSELLAMPQFEQYVTIACVSNAVGGDLVGNARWSGVHLREVLASAGVAAGATQIVGRSVDGFTVGFPTTWALDPSREPMIALGMNGDLLPQAHGYPARLIVPGLYGYVSATKWLAEIELTTREAFDGYWIPLGWAKDGPILTQSRIDTPTNDAGLTAGKVDIGGVAWAPDRGISRVEIAIDDGPWVEAGLARAISKATWVQWMLPWSATTGTHSLEVRATDGTGQLQEERRSQAAPDGARGHHRIAVHVT